jgi:hypothetical protein
LLGRKPCLAVASLGTLVAMAEPTLKDVLKAITTRDAKVDTKLDELRAEMNERFDAVEKRFDALDKELTLHAGVHRELEKDVEALKRRPARTAARPARRR